MAQVKVGFSNKGFVGQAAASSGGSAAAAAAAAAASGDPVAQVKVGFRHFVLIQNETLSKDRSKVHMKDRH